MKNSSVILVIIFLTLFCDKLAPFLILPAIAGEVIQRTVGGSITLGIDRDIIVRSKKFNPKLNITSWVMDNAGNLDRPKSILDSDWEYILKGVLSFRASYHLDFVTLASFYDTEGG